MPVTWELRVDLIVVTLSGAFDVLDIDRARTEVQGDAHFRPGLSLLLDARLSEAETSAARMRQYYELGPSLRALGLGKRWAIVVREQSPVRYGMARMLSVYLDMLGIELMVTKDFDAALASLASRAPAPDPSGGEA